jgi:hypothetical protein
LESKAIQLPGKQKHGLNVALLRVSATTLPASKRTARRQPRHF